jgi:hypothetical protein
LRFAKCCPLCRRSATTTLVASPSEREDVVLALVVVPVVVVVGVVGVGDLGAAAAAVDFEATTGGSGSEMNDSEKLTPFGGAPQVDSPNVT